MQKNMDKIHFESRREIETIIEALDNSSECNNEIVQRMIDLLELMHMEW